MRGNIFTWRAAIVLGLAFSMISLGPAASQTLADLKPSAGPLTIVEQGTFFVGGVEKKSGATGWDQIGLRTIHPEPGEVMDGQMYVQFQKPEHWKRQVPVVMVHGCCLTSKTWETTPDGRMGWAEYFLRRGHAVYLAEQVGRGRSGFDASVINDVRQNARPPQALEPTIVATREAIWQIFRFGPTVGEVWPDEQFPMTHVAELQKQIVPDFILFEYPEMFRKFEQADVANPTVERLSELSASLDGVILMGHSQSSAYPTQAALKGRKGIRGIVQLETGCVTGLTPQQITILAKIPMLVVVGDHFPGPQIPTKCVEEMKSINAAGGDMTFLALPAIGLHGNSHMMMQDRNNLQVADVIMSWIDKHVESYAFENSKSKR